MRSVGFAVGLLEVGTCVFLLFGDEDGPLYGIVGVGVHELFLCGALDGVDQCFLVCHVCGELRPVV